MDAYATERARALRLMRMALLHLTHKDQIYAISAWLLYMAERKQQRRLMRKGHKALMRGAGSELAAGFEFCGGCAPIPIAVCLKKCVAEAVRWLRDICVCVCVCVDATLSARVRDRWRDIQLSACEHTGVYVWIVDAPLSTRGAVGRA